MSKLSTPTPDAVITFHRGVFIGSLLRQDYAALRGVYDDSYVLIRPTGEKLTKQEVIDDLEKASLTFLSVELEEEDVRTYGDAAILTAISRTHTRRGTTENHSRARIVAVYVLRGSTLHLVHYQSTNLS